MFSLFSNPFNNISLNSFAFSANNLLLNATLLYSSFSTSSISDAAPWRPNNSFIQEFLIKSCGLSQKHSVLASKPLSHLKSTRNPEQVLQFLKERGFSDAHIQNTVRRHPRLLISSLQRTLEPKLRLYEDLGIVGDDLGLLISKDPMLLTISLRRKLVPGISFLQEMLKSNDNVVRVLMRNSWVLHVDIEKKLKPNCIFLQSIGVEEKLLWNNLRFLTSSEAWFKDVLNTVEKLGLPRHSGMFPHAMCAVGSMSKGTLEQKIKLFIRLGLSEEEFLVAFRKWPYMVTASEKNLQSHMDFVVKTLKCEPSILVIYPRFFVTSMQGRVMPRYRVLQMLQSVKLPKKVFSVLNMFCIPEKKFLERAGLSSRHAVVRVMGIYQATSMYGYTTGSFGEFPGSSRLETSIHGRCISS
eukprot:Gb_31439 [translate_table: standard]